MKADPSRALRDCLEHITPESIWAEADIQNTVNVNSFRRQSGREPGQSSSKSFLRNGQAGNWREELNRQALSRLEIADQELLRQLGYSD